MKPCMAQMKGCACVLEKTPVRSCKQCTVVSEVKQHHINRASGCNTIRKAQLEWLSALLTFVVVDAVRNVCCCAGHGMLGGHLSAAAAARGRVRAAAGRLLPGPGPLRRHHEPGWHQGAGAKGARLGMLPRCCTPGLSMDQASSRNVRKLLILVLIGSAACHTTCHACSGKSGHGFP